MGTEEKKFLMPGNRRGGLEKLFTCYVYSFFLPFASFPGKPTRFKNGRTMNAFSNTTDNIVITQRDSIEINPESLCDSYRVFLSVFFFFLEWILEQTNNE